MLNRMLTDQTAVRAASYQQIEEQLTSTAADFCVSVALDLDFF
jgi:hypothetical protein